MTGVEHDGRIDVSDDNEPDGPHPFGFDRREDVATAGAVFIYVPKTQAPRR